MERDRLYSLTVVGAQLTDGARQYEPAALVVVFFPPLGREGLSFGYISAGH